MPNRSGGRRTFIKNCPSSVSIIEEACGNCDGRKDRLFGRSEIETGRLPTALLKEALVGVGEIRRASRVAESLLGDTLETGPVHNAGRRRKGQ